MKKYKKSAMLTSSEVIKIKKNLAQSSTNINSTNSDLVPTNSFFGNLCYSHNQDWLLSWNS